MSRASVAPLRPTSTMRGPVGVARACGAKPRKYGVVVGVANPPCMRLAEYVLPRKAMSRLAERH